MIHTKLTQTLNKLNRIDAKHGKYQSISIPAGCHGISHGLQMGCRKASKVEKVPGKVGPRFRLVVEGSEGSWVLSVFSLSPTACSSYFLSLCAD